MGLKNKEMTLNLQKCLPILKNRHRKISYTKMVTRRFPTKEHSFLLRFWHKTAKQKYKRLGQGSTIFSGGGKHLWLTLRACRVGYACIPGWLCSRTPRMMWCKPPTLINKKAYFNVVLVFSFVFSQQFCQTNYWNYSE